MTAAQLAATVEDLAFRDWGFFVETKGDGFLLQVRFLALDRATNDATINGSSERAVQSPVPVEQHGRKWYISSHAVKTEVVRTAWKAVQAAILHEAEEDFLYRGVAIHNPHTEPVALARAAGYLERRPGGREG